MPPLTRRRTEEDDLMDRGPDQMETGRTRSVFQRYPESGDYGPQQTAAIEKINDPGPTFEEPQISKRRTILGNLASVFGGRGGLGRLGQDLLDEPLAKEERRVKYGQAERSADINALSTGATIEGNRQNRMYNIFKGERTSRDLHDFYEVRGRQIESQIGKAEAETEKARRPTMRSARPGSMIFEGSTGKVTNPGDSNQFRNTATTPFSTVRTAEGVFGYNRGTGQRGDRLGGNPVTVNGPGGRGAAGGVAQGRMVESKKQDRLAKWKDSYMKQRQALEADFTKGPEEKAAALDQLNRLDTTQKQQIQNAYEFELKRIGQEGEHFDYEPTTEGMGDQSDLNSLADRAAADGEAEQTVQHGTIAEDPSTGEQIMWNEEAQEWQPVDQQ